MIPLIDWDPQPPKDTAWQRLLLSLGLRKRNAVDERQAKSAEANKPHREADRRRRERQA